ncbi:MAG: hypothetical protein NVS9B15_07600 [Acidobacteriaceae bacterium]
MNLDQIQRAMFNAVQQPLTRSEHMQRNAATAIADDIIKPNDRLSSFERLEIYNRQYWYRLLSALAEDFPGLQAVVGEKQFDKLSLAYLTDCPSESFTLRNLGARLEEWLIKNPAFGGKRLTIALDMVRLEWAEIEAFDFAMLPKLSQEDLAQSGDDPVFHLQPYIRLLELEYPVDEWLIALKHGEDDDHEVSSNAFEERVEAKHRTRPPLSRRSKTYVAVHRDQDDHSIYYKRLDRPAYAILRGLQSGKPLSEAIESAVEWSDSTVEHVTSELRSWFENWSALGWFCRPPSGAP